MKKYSIADIVQYYDKTSLDYRWVWNTRNTHAIHFGFYDEKHQKHEVAVHQLTEVMADMARVQAGERVLDAGCGVGGSSIWLAENRSAIVTGIALPPNQIIDCQKNTSRKKISNINFQVADFTKTPFESELFDVVWACESICHAEQKKDFYQEAFRLLKPGGRLVIAEYCRTTRPLPDAGESLLQNWLQGWAILDIDTIQEHRQNMESIGFQGIRFENVTKNMHTSLRNVHRMSVQWLPFAKLCNKIGLVSDVRIGNATGSVHLYEALQLGYWSYYLISAQK
jgi:tocopherol O-methyltransferase